MDLKHLRTFVTVAEARTVSKASLLLHTSQPALSRQVSNLEQEFGLKLFERIGRRLVLTPVGEQLIEDCRHLLGQAATLGERVGLMRRGDAGVLKVAAPPHTIESVLSTFLVRYAKRFPNVTVELFEALGREQTPMLERGEVHIGIRHDPGDPRFESHMLPPDEALGGVQAGHGARQGRYDRYRSPRGVPALAAAIGVLDPHGYSMPPAASRMSRPRSCWKAARRRPFLRSPRTGTASQSSRRC